MNPKFSIIIPVYNVSLYLRECIDSVLAQTFADWEAICVDDGSTDGSGVILDEYAGKSERIRVVHQRNTGVGKARNLGIGYARANWLLFMDADDVYHPELLEKTNKIINENGDVRMVCFDKLDFNETDRIAWPSDSGCVRTLDASCEFGDVDLTAFLWAKAYHRSVIPQHGFRPYRLAEDRLFVIECALAATCIIRAERQLYGYRHRNGSAVNTQLRLQDFIDRTDCAIDILLAFQKSKRAIAKGMLKMWYSWILHSFVTQVKNLSWQDQSSAWRHWEESQCRVPLLCGMPLSFRIVFVIFKFCPSRCLARGIVSLHQMILSLF